MDNITSTLSTAIFEQDRQRKAAQINHLGRIADSEYFDMAFISKEFYSKKIALQKKKEEQVQIFRAKDILKKDSDSMDIESCENRLLRVAYKALPVLDTIFAANAIRVIMSAKLAEYGEFFAIVGGTIFAIIVGYGISLLSRFAVASLNNAKWWAAPVILCCIMILPTLYIVSEVAFNGGEEWFYSGSFALISLIIQAMIVGGYRKMVIAMDMGTCRLAEIKKKLKKKDRFLKKEIKNIQKEIESLKKNFKLATRKFAGVIRDIGAAYENYQYENSPLGVSSSAAWLANNLVFQKSVLPINNMSSMTKDLEYILYMYDNMGGDYSLNKFLSKGSLEPETRPLLLTADNAA